MGGIIILLYCGVWEEFLEGFSFLEGPRRPGD